MPPKKSVFRQAGAQHFQLVHRSQRDPLINDPEASQRVLKPVGRANERGKSGNTLDDLRHDPAVAAARENEGEAAMYGITYDDSSYDYMQHLKPVGQGGFDSFLIPAPRGSGVAPGMKGGAVKGKGKAKAEDLFLPDGVLASEKELSLQEAYAREENIPAELQGLQPDMNPHLRQVLEALDDEAFEVDEDAGDDGNWFDSLVGGGEVHEGEEAPEFEFEEWGVDEEAPAKPTEAELPEDASWEERFKAFKRDQQARGDDQVSAWGEEDAYDGERSEGADTLGSLPANFSDMIVAGGKKRRGKRGPSDASGMSMSSSAVFRNQGLRDLDDRFDKIEEDYEFDDEEEDFDDSMSLASGMSGMSAMSSMSRASLFSTTSAAPPLVSREDFDSIMDDFLDNYEVVGNKYRQALGGTQLSGPEKLKVLRAAVESEEDGLGKEENRKRIMEIERLGRGVRAPKERMGRVKREGDEGEKWDVETILTTYTNTENHPGMIRSRRPAEQRARAQARADANALAQANLQNGSSDRPEEEDERTENGRSDNEENEEDEDDSGSETETEARVTVARKKGESSEERKARKAGVKAERQARRAEKKSNQKTFGDERRRQIASHRKTVEGGKAADVRGTISLK